MKKNYTLVVAAILALCGCDKHNGPTPAEALQSKESAVSATTEAGKFLHNLHGQGKLPGVSKDEHGELKAKVSDFSETVHFPLSLTFQFTKNASSNYLYTVQRLSTGADWRLIRAWQTDSDGKTVKEFPPQ